MAKLFNSPFVNGKRYFGIAHDILYKLEQIQNHAETFISVAGQNISSTWGLDITEVAGLMCNKEGWSDYKNLKESDYSVFEEVPNASDYRWVAKDKVDADFLIRLLTFFIKDSGYLEPVMLVQATSPDDEGYSCESKEDWILYISQEVLELFPPRIELGNAHFACGERLSAYWGFQSEKYIGYKFSRIVLEDYDVTKDALSYASDVKSMIRYYAEMTCSE